MSHHHASDQETETLNVSLNDDATRAAYREKYDGYRPGPIPRILGSLLVWCGNVVYGRKPSYLKFRAVEVIARVPYHSWESALYTLLTLFYTNEERAIKYSRLSRFAHVAQDNETMHVVVVSQLARAEGNAGAVRHTLIPMVFAFGYFWASYWLYLISPRASFELNYLFESHAYLQYDEFIKTNAEKLRGKPVQSAFLAQYGRTPKDEYEFFRSVRNDELIHRNRSIEEIEARARLRH